MKMKRTWLSEFGSEYSVPPEVLNFPGIVDNSWHNDASPSFTLPRFETNEKRESSFHHYVELTLAGIAKSTDYGELADLAIEYCRQSRVAKDIAALARVFGASQEAINLAIRYDFRTVSLIRNLAMTH